jgi:hypothetical protein
MAEMQIKIAADVSSAVSGLDKLNKELDQTAKDAVQLGNAVDNAGQKIRTLPNVTGQATSTLTNFSRVVQDAPFGLIGIANNIDPLISSFNQLKATTGTTGGAFKALLSQLAGPAGIALAVSTVTSLLITFGDKIFGSGKAADKAAEENDRYAESVKNIVDQLKAEKDAIDLVVSGQADLSRRRQQNVRLSFGEGIETDILLLKGQISITARALSDNRDAISKAFAEENALYDNYINKKKDVYGKLIVPEEKYQERLKPLVDARFALQDQEIKLTEQLANQRLQLKVLENKNTEQKNKEALDAYKEYVQRTIAEAKKLSAFLGKTVTINLDISPLDDENTILKKSEEYLNKFRKGLYNYSLTVPPIEIEMPIRFSDEPAEIERLMSPVAAEMKNAMENYFKRTEPLDGSLLLAVDLEKLKKFEFMGFKDLTKAQKDLAETGAMIAGVITPSLDAMIQAVARGENAFEAFGQGVKAILVQVIQKLAATAILAGILSAIFPGGLGGAQGFGQIFGRLAGFRATGGPVSGGSPYVVGERGPELFVPAVSGSIVPNNAVGSFMSGRSNGGGSGMSLLRGQDILLAYARTQRSQLRVNG